MAVHHPCLAQQLGSLRRGGGAALDDDPEQRRRDAAESVGEAREIVELQGAVVGGRNDDYELPVADGVIVEVSIEIDLVDVVGVVLELADAEEEGGRRRRMVAISVEEGCVVEDDEEADEEAGEEEEEEEGSGEGIRSAPPAFLGLNKNGGGRPEVGDAGAGRGGEEGMAGDGGERATDRSHLSPIQSSTLPTTTAAAAAEATASIKASCRFDRRRDLRMRTRFRRATKSEEDYGGEERWWWRQREESRSRSSERVAVGNKHD